MAIPVVSPGSLDELAERRSLLEGRIVFDRVLWVLDDPSVVWTGELAPEEFLRWVVAAFAAVPDPSSYEALQQLARAVAVREALVGWADGPWRAIDRGLSQMSREWGWAAA